MLEGTIKAVDYKNILEENLVSLFEGRFSHVDQMIFQNDFAPCHRAQLHEITGRALLRINDNSLQRMGITDNRDREAIWREIVKQRLKTDIMEIRDLERMNSIYYS